MESTNSRFDVVGQLAALRRYARTLTRSDAASEDLVHDALVRAYEKRSKFREGANLRSWLLALMHNVYIDAIRKSHAYERGLKDIPTLWDQVTLPSQEHHVRLGQIRAAFMDLPEEQRAAVHLVAVEGLSFEEAAAVLGIPNGTLMSRLARGRAALRTFDEGEENAQRPERRPNLTIVGGSDGTTN